MAEDRATAAANRAAALSISCSGNPGDPYVICQSGEATATIVDGVVTIERIAAASSVSSGPPSILAELIGAEPPVA